MTAIYKFNSYDTSATQEDRNICFDNMRIDSSYASAMRLGENSTGQTHHITGFRVTNSEIGWLGNQTSPWIVLDGAADSSKCHGIDEAQTTWDDYVFNNWIHDCSGDGINSNLGNYADGSGNVTNTAIGNYDEEYNKIERTYSSIVHYGNYAWNVTISNNKLLDWTNEGGFGLSCESQKGVYEKNTIQGYEGRTPCELYGIGNKFDFGNTISYLGKSANPASWRINTVGQTQLCYTGGYCNSYYGNIGYDSSFGVSPKIATALRGILISRQYKPGEQPASYQNKAYTWGFYLHCTISGVTGRAVCAEISGIAPADVLFADDCRIITSAMAVNDNLIAIYAPDASTKRKGWNFREGFTIDVKGSPTANSGYALINFGSLQGTTPTRSILYGAKVFQDNNTPVFLSSKQGMFENVQNPKDA